MQKHKATFVYVNGGDKYDDDYELRIGGRKTFFAIQVIGRTFFSPYRFDGQALDYFGEYSTLDAAKAATVKQYLLEKLEK